jgi:hypothetical protein
MVTSGAVTATGANSRVSAFSVQNGIACRAPGVLWEEVVQQAGSDLNDEFRWSPSKSLILGGDGLKEARCARELL